MVAQQMTFELAMSQHQSQKIYSPIDHVKMPTNETYFIKSEHEGRLVGFYTQKERSIKIEKYKIKLSKWKQCNKDAFNGRSRVAKKKLRYFGRFIKSEDFKDKLISDEQILKNNYQIDCVTEKGDYNSLVDIITQNPSEIK